MKSLPRCLTAAIALSICTNVAAYAGVEPGDEALALVPEEINAIPAASAVEAGKSSDTLRAQVLLERAHFSPGEIDGLTGSNMRRALNGFQQREGLTPTGRLDEATWAALKRDSAPVLIEYEITAEDVAGPFVPIPEDMMEKAELDKLGYTSPLEGLAEKFHSSPKLLKQLNVGADFAAAGSRIIVPNVTTTELPKAAKVVVDESDKTVSLVDDAGATIAQFPATSGSKHDPLPVGEWKVNGVQRDPKFHYNPELFWDAEAGHAKATIPAGPNNPVGVAWLDLSKEHYGIHGTPEPSTIGKTQSHGCIRMTNWSVAAIAKAVPPGTPAILQE